MAADNVNFTKFSEILSFSLNFTKFSEIPPFSSNFTKFRVNGAPARNLDLVPRNMGRFGDHSFRGHERIMLNFTKFHEIPPFSWNSSISAFWATFPLLGGGYSSPAQSSYVGL